MPATPPPTKKKSRAGLIIGLLVVALLVIGGVAAAIVVMSGSSDAELTVDTCEIASDGTLSATGTVSGASGDRVRVEVDFVDVATDDDADSADVDVALDGGDGTWSASGSAGADVNQVSCEATLDD